jgi:hypothetical protein
MPPIGFALGDEQIASVLTYVRREWGQTGAPIDAATVKAVRASTAGRTRPWTNDGLLMLAKDAVAGLPAGGRNGERVHLVVADARRNVAVPGAPIDVSLHN